MQAGDPARAAASTPQTLIVSTPTAAAAASSPVRTPALLASSPSAPVPPPPGPPPPGPPPHPTAPRGLPLRRACLARRRLLLYVHPNPSSPSSRPPDFARLQRRRRRRILLLFLLSSPPPYPPPLTASSPPQHPPRRRRLILLAPLPARFRQRTWGRGLPKRRCGPRRAQIWPGRIGSSSSTCASSSLRRHAEAIAEASTAVTLSLTSFRQGRGVHPLIQGVTASNDREIASTSTFARKVFLMVA